MPKLKLLKPTLGLALMILLVLASAHAADKKPNILVIMSDDVGGGQAEPLGGKPPPGSKPSVADLDYQVRYQRAFEAVLWSVPAVALYGFIRGATDIGANDNTILAWSEPARPNAELGWIPLISRI